MADNLRDDAALAMLHEAQAGVLVDVRHPGGLEAAVHGALEAAGLRRDRVAIVLVPLNGIQPAWPGHTLGRGPSDAGDGLVINALAHEVVLHGQPVRVTVKEFALLHYLYERRGVVITREELLRDVWGQRYSGGPRTVDIHVRRLRAKLGAHWLETRRGVGYKFRRRH